MEFLIKNLEQKVGFERSEIQKHHNKLTMMQSEDQKTTSFDLLEVVEERIKYLALVMSQSDREELAGEVVRYLADRGE